MSIQSENQSSLLRQLKQRSNSRITRLEARMDRMEERVAELEQMAVQVDGEITSLADWRERQSRNL